jgi:hypothetical protein
MDLFVINHRHTHRFPAHAILQVLRCFHSSGLCYMLFYFAKSGQGVGKMQLDQRSSHWTACIPHDFLNEKKNGCKLTLRSRKVLAGLRGQITAIGIIPQIRDQFFLACFLHEAMSTDYIWALYKWPATSRLDFRRVCASLHELVSLLPSCRWQ